MNQSLSFDRSFLRACARSSLKGNYWRAFVASLVIYFCVGNGTRNTGSASYANSTRSVNPNGYPPSGGDLGFFDWLSAVMVPAFIAVLLLVVVAVICFTIFVMAPLGVGGHRFFLESTQRRNSLSNLGYAFSSGGYMNIVSAMFLRELYTVLWTLLFIIPGIIKGYSYYLVPYILAENPHLTAEQSITLSRRMTNGYKMQIFLLELSFLGWTLLGALCMGVGIFFVRPYIDTTMAHLYLTLRASAIDRGITTAAELTPRAAV